MFANGSLGGGPRRPTRPVFAPSSLTPTDRQGSADWSMNGCHYPSPPALGAGAGLGMGAGLGLGGGGGSRDQRYQHKVSLVVRYFMIPCNICLILLAVTTLGLAVLLFLNNCCRGMLCGFGAVCERNPADTAKAACVCKRAACPSVVAPVCGSDSSTYSNECELEKAQCNTQRRIKVLRKGPCSLKDPCTEVSCSYGSTCVQSSDGVSAKCMCPLGCEGRPQLTVCGSDGHDYRNEYPCKDKQNSLNVVCRVEAGTREPRVFSPPEDCPTGETLCASDGHTYASECAMTRTGLLKRDKQNSLNVVCRVEAGSREPLVFSPPEDCPTGETLCANDGHTYASECAMTRTGLLKRVRLRKNHAGPCKKPGSPQTGGSPWPR
ncbi:hypothetical protein CRUP_024049 [Coryphaenoides rupestris]|nr:hypothetical protein CRUP_024049 [Coryphaenoides rupestris]